MIPASFDYEVAESPAHALSLLAEFGEDAKLLAGGHSLLPMMKVRLAQPAVLIDIARVTELSGIRIEGDEVVIGATTRHAELAGSELLRAEAPILAYAAAQVGDPQIRHRGTIGGSLAHADPSADLPLTLLALGGSVELTGPSGVRLVGADDFFVGPFESALGPDELLGDRRRRRLRRPGRAGLHGRHAAARAGDRAGARVRGVGRRGRSARGRGHLPWLRLPRQRGLPRAPRPRPGQAGPGGQGRLSKRRWIVGWHRVLPTIHFASQTTAGSAPYTGKG
jgi:carbon-monoxide dehydrogenase medium subunit